MKNLILLTVWMLFAQESEKSEQWITYLTEEDGTVHKCKPEEYDEMMELLSLNEINDNLNMNTYYCWEKDFISRMAEVPNRTIDYGKLKEIADRNNKVIDINQ